MTLKPNKIANENRIVSLLVVVAMIRVFLFSAALPLFTPVDELQHCDTVIKYAKGYVPHKGEDTSFSPWVAAMEALYGSPEYFLEVPRGTLPNFRNSQNSTVAVKEFYDHEIHSPPVYYFLAGKWCNLGRALGLADGFQLYWIRFMNIIIAALLLFTAYLYCRYFFPEEPALRLGVPMLLALFPNDVFYYMNNDVLSPVVCLLGLFMLYRVQDKGKPVIFSFLAGLMVAASVLVKLTNVPFYLFSLLCTQLMVYRRFSRREKPGGLGPFAALGVGMLLPVIVWVAWNWYSFGDITGDSFKLQALGITKKPVGAWLDHPLFRLDGLVQTFDNLRLLVITFWRGEVVTWQGRSTIVPPADAFYLGTSLLFVTAAIVKLFKNHADAFSKSTFPRLSAVILLALHVLFLLFLSVSFDFGNNPTPSRLNPFFNKGRLILGCLVPFLILYVDGMAYLMEKVRLRINPLYGVGFVGLLTLVFSTGAYFRTFGSLWNWFHLY